MNKCELSIKKMDVSEKIISSGILGIDKDVFPTKGKLAKKKSYRKAFEEMKKTGQEAVGGVRSRLGVMDGTGENGVDAGEVT